MIEWKMATSIGMRDKEENSYLLVSENLRERGRKGCNHIHWWILVFNDT